MKPGQIATARAIVTNPERHTPRIRYLSWLMLKSARGQSVRQSNLPPLPKRAAPGTPFAIRRQRIEVRRAGPAGGRA